MQHTPGPPAETVELVESMYALEQVPERLRLRGRAPMSAMGQKRTSRLRLGTSALCQKRTWATRSDRRELFET